MGFNSTTESSVSFSNCHTFRPLLHRFSHLLSPPLLPLCVQFDALDPLTSSATFLMASTSASSSLCRWVPISSSE